LTELTISSNGPAAIPSDLTGLSQLLDLALGGDRRAANDSKAAPSGLQQLLPLTALTGLTGLYSRQSSELRLESKVSDWLGFAGMTVIDWRACLCGANKRGASGLQAFWAYSAHLFLVLAVGNTEHSAAARACFCAGGCRRVP
jgi:hypothetical protein